jgi:hypothetical protein
MLSLAVPICGPGLRQVVVEDCWAHRGLLCCALAGGIQRDSANGVGEWLKSC